MRVDHCQIRRGEERVRLMGLRSTLMAALNEIRRCYLEHKAAGFFHTNLLHLHASVMFFTFMVKSL